MKTHTHTHAPSLIFTYQFHFYSPHICDVYFRNASYIYTRNIFIPLHPFCIWIFFLYFFHWHWKSITPPIPLDKTRKPKSIEAISLFAHLLYIADVPIPFVDVWCVCVCVCVCAWLLPPSELVLNWSLLDDSISIFTQMVRK